MGAAAERRLLVVAGEASGDAHAARMLRAFGRVHAYRAHGVAGPALRAAGVEAIEDASALSVVGFSGVLQRLPRLMRVFRRLDDEARRFKPEAAVLVDSPGFNFRAGPSLKRAGVKIFYYIAPQVWAWHPERARAMSRWVDRLAVVFPFEEQLFRDAGVPTTYVGHPLLEDLHPEIDAGSFRAELGVTPDATLLGLLPGSREQEVRAHAPVMLEAAARLASSRPSLVPVMALAPDVSPERLAALVGGTLDPGAPANGPWRVRRGKARVCFVRGRTRAVQAHASACAVASGTATLETALFATPLVIVYRMGWLNYAIARRLVSLSHVGLPNIVAGSEVAPELIQDAFTPERVAEALAPWLDDPAARAEASRGLSAVRARLGMAGASERAAEALAELLA